MEVSQATIDELRRTLPGKAALKTTQVKDLIKKRRIPRDLPFGPSHCLSDRGHIYLIYTLSTDSLPARVIDAKDVLGTYPKISVVIVAVHSPSTVAYKNANSVAEECLRLGYGLVTESEDGSFLVFLPNYTVPQCSN